MLQAETKQKVRLVEQYFKKLTLAILIANIKLMAGDSARGHKAKKEWA